MTETKREFWILNDAIGNTQDFLTWEPTRHTVADFTRVIEYSAFSSLETKLAEYEGAHSCSVKCEKPLCVANRKLQKAVAELKCKCMCWPKDDPRHARNPCGVCDLIKELES